MKVLSKDHVIYFFNQENPACYRVEDGETFWVETDDCYSGQIKDASVKRPDIDISIMDCSVGPIYIEGAMPGDTLCVEILAIQFAPQGVMVTSKGLGVLGERIQEPDTKIIPIRDGGNLDTKLVTVGSRLYLPVEQEGAGLAVGDLHACMGDGELSGTGIETPGRICIRTSVRRNCPVSRPVIETRDALYFLASAPTLDEAIHTAVSDGVQFLQEKLSLSFPDAYRLLSAVCDIQISQVVNDWKTARLHCPKFDTKIETL